jgi:hypothetical protein
LPHTSNCSPNTLIDLSISITQYPRLTTNAQRSGGKAIRFFVCYVLFLDRNNVVSTRTFLSLPNFILNCLTFV